MATTSLGAAVGLCDSSYCSSTFSTPNSTLVFFLEFNDGLYYLDYDLGPHVVDTLPVPLRLRH